MSTSRFLRALYLVLLVMFGIPAYSQSDDVGVHDPVMIQSDGYYYVFSTGRGISMHRSSDMINWEEIGPVFSEIPSWTFETVDGFRGHIWAPDIHFYNGKYYLYYSVSSFGKNTSAIGLATNVTLDPDDPSYEWMDEGMIIQSIPGRDLWNAIDPNVVVDEEGYPWLSFGSFWTGIKLVKLIPNRTALEEPQRWFTIARREREAFTEDQRAGSAAIEAPFIFKKDSLYYLFVSWDYCCRGEESTYKVVVGRSDKVTGPYLDKNGVDMAKGGGSLVIEGDSNWAGVGHNSAYTFNGRDYLVFHAYDIEDNGRSKLKISSMEWDADGWPLVDKSVLEK